MIVGQRIGEVYDAKGVRIETVCQLLSRHLPKGITHDILKRVSPCLCIFFMEAEDDVSALV